MHPARQTPKQQHGLLLPSSCRCMDRLGGMPILRRCGAVLVVRPAGQKCGAVVPHCDFQKCYTEIALCKGVSPYARPRNARPRPRPPTMTKMACSCFAAACNTPRYSYQDLDPLRLSADYRKFSLFDNNKKARKVCRKI